MGLLQALISIIECDNDNKLNYVVAGDHKIVFLHKTHLILVCVSSEPDQCVEQLELELNYCYNQIISVIITKVYFEKDIIFLPLGCDIVINRKNIFKAS